MSIPYRTRRVLNTFGTVLLVVMLAAIIAWLCWVVWLQRYVVYEDGSARLDFGRSANDIVGVEAKPPVVEEGIGIYYNEGADAINTTKELSQLNGYYITDDMFRDDMEYVMLQVERLPAGTPVMIDLKGPYGSFFYSSKLSNAVHSASTDIAAVDTLIAKLQSKGFYTIARVHALNDYNFGLNHVSAGLYNLNRVGLWPDANNYYWLDPTNAETTKWISDVVMELRDMGFNEVVLADFHFPHSEKYLFNGDKSAALQEAAVKLVQLCEANNFTLSFCVEDPAFPLPGERCRIYLEGVSATALATSSAKVTFENPEVHLVFLSETADTRYDDYSVMRALNIAEEVEARKG